MPPTQQLLGWLPLDWIAAPPVSSPRTLAGDGSSQQPTGAGLAQRLGLPPDGLRGHHPLPWWASASYEGPLRHELLQLRQMAGSAYWQGRLDRLLQACLPGLASCLLADFDNLIQAPLLVPIPSWKRRANPLPSAFAQQLGQVMGWQIDATLLRRRRPVLGQHHLGRQLRWANQAEAFVCAQQSRQRRGPRQPLLLVDDILTTGATLWGAAETLRLEGWRVAGACCLARTPAKGSQEAKGAVI